jgi:hypothetical protein
MDNKSKCKCGHTELAHGADGKSCLAMLCLCKKFQPCVEPEPQKVIDQLKNNPEIMAQIKQGMKERREGNVLPWNQVRKELGIEPQKVEREIINTNPDLLGNPEPIKFGYKQAKGKVFCNNCKEWVNDIDADAHVKGCWVCGKLVPITAPIDRATEPMLEANHIYEDMDPEDEPEPNRIVLDFIDSEIGTEIRNIYQSDANAQLPAIIARAKRELAREILNDVMSVVYNNGDDNRWWWENKMLEVKSKYEEK